MEILQNLRNRIVATALAFTTNRHDQFVLALDSLSATITITQSASCRQERSLLSERASQADEELLVASRQRNKWLRSKTNKQTI